MLHTAVSRHLYVLLESNCSHASSFFGGSHGLSVIFSDAKDEAWSQHKHLHECDELKHGIIYYSSNGR